MAHTIMLPTLADTLGALYLNTSGMTGLSAPGDLFNRKNRINELSTLKYLSITVIRLKSNTITNSLEKKVNYVYLRFVTTPKCLVTKMLWCWLARLSQYQTLTLCAPATT